MCNVRCANEIDRWYRVKMNDGTVINGPVFRSEKSGWEEKDERIDKVEGFVADAGYTRDDIKSIRLMVDNNQQDDDSVCISEHALERMSERFGWNRKASVRMTRKIFDNGTKEDGLLPYIKTWMDKREKKYGDRNHYIVYGDIVFVMSGNILVTVYNIPKNYAMRHDRMGYSRSESKKKLNRTMAKYGY